MFYVYDIDGLRFQGSLEDLESRRVERTRPIKALIENGTTFGKLLDEETGKSFNTKAIRAYQGGGKKEALVEPLVHVYQIMSTPVSTVGGDIPLYNAWLMLKESNIRQLVVTSLSRDVLGVLSDRNIFQHIKVIDGRIEVQRDLLVSEVLPKETYTTDAISDIRRVARVMAFYHLDAIPVMERERLVGIVTRGDILRGFAANPKLNLWA
jgi:acetoin utilization protein AcuB